jgi:hypothetical protein
VEVKLIKGEGLATDRENGARGAKRDQNGLLRAVGHHVDIGRLTIPVEVDPGQLRRRHGNDIDGGLAPPVLADAAAIALASLPGRLGRGGGHGGRGGEDKAQQDEAKQGRFGVHGSSWDRLWFKGTQ